MSAKTQYCRRWKQGQATKDEHRNTAQACGDSIRKAKAQMEFCLVGDIKGNKNFYHNISGKKRWTRKPWVCGKLGRLKASTIRLRFSTAFSALTITSMAFS